MKIRFYEFRALGIALLIMAASLAAGCAKIADPMPPGVRIPRPAADLDARQRANSVILTVSRPLLNTDGSPADDLRKVQILRLAYPAGAVKSKPYAEEQFLKMAAPIITITAADFPNYLRNGSFVLEDDLSPLQKSDIYSSELRYAVLFINKRNQAAGISNQVRIRPVVIPPPPREISAQTTENAIRIQWSQPPAEAESPAPSRIAGYNIYRSEDPEKIDTIPINADVVPGSVYEDRNFTFDRTYYYHVRTVASRMDPYAESGPSEMVRVAARDVFPPAPPGNFIAVTEKDGVILLWAPSPSQDAAGYRLYRRETGAADRKLIEQELISALNYRDNAAESGKTYEYVLHAVDGHGNLSSPVRIAIDVP